LVGSIYGRSSIQIANFIPNRKHTWLPPAILVSDWLISKKSSPLKLPGQMNENLVGSILSGFEGEDFKKSADQKQELPVVAMFVIGSGQTYQSV
jgi:hypothetical protein